MKAWMLSVPRLAYQYADQIVANMPTPRYKAYENSNFQDIQNAVIDYLYQIQVGMGLF